MRYKLNGANTSAEIFARMTAIMNPIAMARFCETMCHSIFKHLLATGSNDRGLFGPISTHFGIVETNGQGILHLHCLVWFCDIFYITQLCKRLQANFEYAACVVEFINRIIICSIITEDKTYVP